MLTRKDCIIVRSGILVYEGIEDENGYSGSYIHEYLIDHWYDDVAYTNTFPESLEGYDAVFLSLGNSGYHGTYMNEFMSNTIYEYAFQGGKIYLEGSDAVRFAETTWGAFGLSTVDNGKKNLLTDLMGQPGSIMDGVSFSGSEQYEQKSIDLYTIEAAAEGTMVAFSEGEYGPVAVQYDGSEVWGQKTFCMSYALADLENGEGNSTRDEVLRRILNFFDVVMEVDEIQPTSANKIQVYPNPATNQLTISNLDVNSEIQLTDLSGNVLINQSATEASIVLNISNLPAGIYLIRTDTGVKKFVKM